MKGYCKASRFGCKSECEWRGEKAAFECELVHRKIMCVLATGALSFLNGASLAIHDVRNTSKAICFSRDM